MKDHLCIQRHTIMYTIYLEILQQYKYARNFYIHVYIVNFHNLNYPLSI